MAGESVGTLVWLFKAGGSEPEVVEGDNGFQADASYAVLHTKEADGAKVHIFYLWTGTHSEEDSRDAADVFAMELGQKLGSAVTREDEAQGEESAEFKQLFPSLHHAAAGATGTSALSAAPSQELANGHAAHVEADAAPVAAADDAGVNDNGGGDGDDGAAPLADPPHTASVEPSDQEPAAALAAAVPGNGAAAEAEHAVAAAAQEEEADAASLPHDVAEPVAPAPVSEPSEQPAAPPPTAEPSEEPLAAAASAAAAAAATASGHTAPPSPRPEGTPLKRGSSGAAAADLAPTSAAAAAAPAAAADAEGEVSSSSNGGNGAAAAAVVAEEEVAAAAEPLPAAPEDSSASAGMVPLDVAGENAAGGGGAEAEQQGQVPASPYEVAHAQGFNPSGDDVLQRGSTGSVQSAAQELAKRVQEHGLQPGKLKAPPPLSRPPMFKGAPPVALVSADAAAAAPSPFLKSGGPTPRTSVTSLPSSTHDKANTVNASQLLRMGSFRLKALQDFVPYDELLKMRLEDGIDSTRREDYLDEDEFARVFGITRAAYVALPAWKKTLAKKKVHLF